MVKDFQFDTTNFLDLATPREMDKRDRTHINAQVKRDRVKRTQKCRQLFEKKIRSNYKDFFSRNEIFAAFVLQTPLVETF